MTSTKDGHRKVAVLDTSAFVAGYDPFSVDMEQYTVPSVREEIMGNSILRIRFKTALESGRLKIRAPEKTFIDAAKECAAQMGDKFFLSETDLQVLALAEQLRTQGYAPSIVTDDYSIQNVADQMDIEFASLATLGIRYKLQWLRYCPACYKKYPADYRARVCQICGTELKRKPVRKQQL